MIITLWNWMSPAWLIAAALIFGYWSVFRNTAGRRVWFFLAGIVVFLIAYISPIGVLADGYLFSAHMVQHLLLLLIVPLLLLLSIPPAGVESGLLARLAKRVGAGLRRVPLIGWICGVGAMWFWHIPMLCSASTESAALGAVRDASFLLAGLAFWWPVYAPANRDRLRPPQAITYLFSACLGCTMLGVYITFTPLSICPAFLRGGQHLGLMQALRGGGLTPPVDQQLGGLLMWVPPCSLYVGAIISMLCRWYSVGGDETAVATKDGLAID